MPASTRELPYPDVDIDAVRKYVNQRANQSSVREVARRIGVRNTSLTRFLDGSTPYARHRAVLCEWYLRETGQHPETGAAQPQHLLEALLDGLHGAAREEARLRILQALSEGHLRQGRPEPEWLERGEVPPRRPLTRGQ